MAEADNGLLHARRVKGATDGKGREDPGKKAIRELFVFEKGVVVDGKQTGDEEFGGWRIARYYCFNSTDLPPGGAR